ncbi:MAG: glycosyltransferase [Erythrobacter sp.]|nr:glycosyltransferase [Erythrobacter sp.]
MILVTVGMQLAFDRLVQAMDELAPSLAMPVVAQTGEGEYRPRNIEAHARLAPAEFERRMRASRLIVSHAGIGTVLAAQRAMKPVVLFPRRMALGEHRNDHQLATVAQLAERSGILVAMTADDLPETIARGLDLQFEPGAALPSPNAAGLHEAIASFIETGSLGPDLGRNR